MVDNEQHAVYPINSGTGGPLGPAQRFFFLALTVVALAFVI